jgi:hypothetical protein
MAWLVVVAVAALAWTLGNAVHAHARASRDLLPVRIRFLGPAAPPSEPPGYRDAPPNAHPGRTLDEICKRLGFLRLRRQDHRRWAIPWWNPRPWRFVVEADDPADVTAGLRFFVSHRGALVAACELLTRCYGPIGVEQDGASVRVESGMTFREIHARLRPFEAGRRR